MNIPSIKTKYPLKGHFMAEGFKEYRLDVTGMIDNADVKSWKYNRQFFNQAIMNPSFNNQAVEWTNEFWSEMEFYWNKLGENYKLDLMRWMHRFANDMIYKISTGEKNNSIASYYYYTFAPESSDLNEKEKESTKNLKITLNHWNH